MRNSTNTRRGRRGADGQRLANRQPQKKMSGTSKAKGKGSSGVGKNRDEMKKADHDWANNPRWKGISRNYSVSDVRRLQGNVIIEHTLARRGAEKLWSLLQAEPFINALGALTGNQALQQVKAGLKAIYLSGWQVAADANLAGQMYPDQSLYPANSVPAVVKRINQTLQRADQIARAEGKNDIDWFVPIVADAEAGFGGPLNVFELIKAMIEAGAAGVHLEDQLASEKKCGHMGGKVLVPTRAAIAHLIAARLAADVCDVPTLILARTDANAAALAHQRRRRTRPRVFDRRADASKDSFAYAPAWIRRLRADLVTRPSPTYSGARLREPNLAEAKKFAEGIHARFPGKLLAYNCSPSFNWTKKLDSGSIAKFQRELGAMGYKFQFVTLAGFHALNYSMFQLARGYRDRGMEAYAELQEAEFAAEKHGYSATRHQHEVGTGYFDDVAQVIAAGLSSTTALRGSTEQEQFH